MTHLQLQLLKGKGAARILTFSVSHSPVQVQVLSTQTLYDLVDVICRETTIGRNESADAHMWNIRLLPGRRVYESGDFPCQSERRANRTMLSDLALVPKTTTMIFNYDYGDDLEYKITCEETNGNTGDTDPVGVDESLFPRRKPTVAPNGYILYDAQDVDLNALFPTFNGWAFQDQDAPPVELNLFQAGGKQNHGYVQKDKDGLIHMIFLPCQAGDDLSVYLHCFDYASQFKYATHGYPLATSYFTRQQLDNIQRKAMSIIFAKCGYNRNTKRDILYGPLELGGANFRRLYDQQGIGQVQLFHAALEAAIYSRSLTAVRGFLGTILRWHINTDT
ncbi:hypothetical protein MHU86_8204 [Fragilaria crotonensis]|nr:hypothetical protein MHU86_8204 [Fragilaria crotonensis]